MKQLQAHHFDSEESSTLEEAKKVSQMNHQMKLPSDSATRHLHPGPRNGQFVEGVLDMNALSFSQNLLWRLCPWMAAVSLQKGQFFSLPVSKTAWGVVLLFHLYCSHFSTLSNISLGFRSVHLAADSALLKIFFSFSVLVDLQHTTSCCTGPWTSSAWKYSVRCVLRQTVHGVAHKSLYTYH